MNTKFGEQAAVSLRNILNTASRDFREQEGGTRIKKIPLEALDSFKEHPFHVRDDEEMRQLVESIRENGVLTPVAVREKEDGRYELISGHRRRRACELAGIDSIPAVVLPLDDDGAVIAMVDANLQREHILPSEKAFAYKMKYDAIKHQGTSSQLETKRRSDEVLGADSGESRAQVQRYIRLTCLIPPLLDMVDEEKLSFTTGVALSYLRESEQRTLFQIMQSESYGSYVPCLAHAEELKRRSKEGNLSEADIRAVLFGTPSVKTASPTEFAQADNLETISDEELERREEEAFQNLKTVMENLTTPKENTDEAPMGIVIDGEGEILPPGDDNLHVTLVKEKTPKEKAAANLRRALKALRSVFEREQPHRTAELEKAASSLERFLTDEGV